MCRIRRSRRPSSRSADFGRESLARSASCKPCPGRRAGRCRLRLPGRFRTASWRRIASAGGPQRWLENPIFHGQIREAAEMAEIAGHRLAGTIAQTRLTVCVSSMQQWPSGRIISSILVGLNQSEVIEACLNSSVTKWGPGAIAFARSAVGRSRINEACPARTSNARSAGRECSAKTPITTSCFRKGRPGVTARPIRSGKGS